jgi:excisionase family DNA binding protein
MNTQDRILLDKKTAAALLSISPRTLEYLIARKEIGVRRIGRRTLIPRRELERFAGRDHTSPSSGVNDALTI